MPICPDCGAEFKKGNGECPECGAVFEEDEEDVEEVEEVADEIDTYELYVAGDRLEAERIKMILEENDIDCSLRVVDSSSFPAGDDEVRIVVNVNDVDEAREIIEERIEDEIISDDGYFIDPEEEDF